jgi:hypothetical protein
MMTALAFLLLMLQPQAGWKPGSPLDQIPANIEVLTFTCYEPKGLASRPLFRSSQL